MATKNVKSKGYYALKTHEGAPAKRINDKLALKRSVLACLLWEDSFYESGESITDRIKNLVAKCESNFVIDLAKEARTKFKLRHVPLLLLREEVRKGSKIADALEFIIQRADELSEFLAMYWDGEKTPISAQVKKGLARAFTKFDEYQLAKYNRANIVKLRDVLFLTHAKPKDFAQAELWKKLVNDTLEIPGTWENELSAGKDKKEAFTRLISEKKLGALALIRNLRNMVQTGVDTTLVKEAILNMRTERILPFRFISAEKYAPTFSKALEQAMFKCLKEHEKLSGATTLLIDVSGSMDAGLSNKSDLLRMEAAAALAMLINEISDDTRIFTFSDNVVEVPARKGFGLKDAIIGSQFHNGTYLGRAISEINNCVDKKDRLIVFSDEQSHDAIPALKFERAYMINVASYQNGVGYGNGWTAHITGFSEAVVDYILAYEKDF